jgi:hypothetical protein
VKLSKSIPFLFFVCWVMNVAVWRPAEQAAGKNYEERNAQADALQTIVAGDFWGTPCS